MKIYESMFILHNRELPEEEAAEPQDVVRALVEKVGGAVSHSQIWANRKLAYPVAGNQTATYVLAYITGEPKLISELQHQVGISERVLRLVAFAIDELPTEFPGPLSEPVSRGSRDDPVEEEKPEEGAPPPTKAERRARALARLDYKNVHHLRRMVTAQGKLFSRVRSGLSAHEQRRLRSSVLRARNLALLPFVAR